MSTNGGTAVFGGTFDPPHNGHLAFARTALSEFGFDRMLIIPDNIPPHKEQSGGASREDRLQMCRLMFTDPGMSVSETELKRQGKSYTYDTLCELERLYPQEKLFLLVGTDMLLCFEKWYRFRDILKKAAIVAACRSSLSSQEQQLRKKAEELKEAGAHVYICTLEPFEVSSTQIRKLISEFKSIGGYVPQAVADYIKDGGLYCD